MKRYLYACVVFVLVLAGCGSSTQPVTSLKVVASDFSYTPGTITVPLGQEVTLDFSNDGQVEHDFVIASISVSGVEGNTLDSETAGHHMHGMDYDLHVSTNPGESATLKFTPQAVGEYQIFCTVEGHQEAGMIGKLIVVDQS